MSGTERLPFKKGDVDCRRANKILLLTEAELIPVEDLADVDEIKVNEVDLGITPPVVLFDESYDGLLLTEMPLDDVHDISDVSQAPYSSDEIDPFGDVLDWAEAESVGLHLVGSGSGIRITGDMYNNGNHASHSSYLSGMKRAGHDIASIEGFDAQLH